MSFSKIRSIEYLDDSIDLSKCEITEKIDGSQISWELIDGQLTVYGKNTQIYPSDQPVQKVYKSAVTHLISIKEILLPNFVYYGEALATPRHNAIKYDRIPENHIMLWAGHDKIANEWLPVPSLTYHAINQLKVEPPYEINGNNLSILGGDVIEGVVYSFISPDGQTITKFKAVSPEFKEVKAALKDRKRDMKGCKTDIWAEFKARFKTQARWDKAIQHLRDDGKLTNTESDIGSLFKEVMQDIINEESFAIQEFFNKTFRKELLKGATDGLADYYKQFLKNAL